MANNDNKDKKVVAYGPTIEATHIPRLHWCASCRNHVGLGGPVKVYRKLSEVRKIKNKREEVKNERRVVIGYNEIFPEATQEQYKELSFSKYVEAK